MNNLTRRSFLNYAAASAVAAALPGCAHQAIKTATGRKPNIIFILADDLGYGDLGCYGQTMIQTPNIDRLAGQGVRFTQTYAGSTVCAPSRSCLMTGLHTGHTFVRGNSKTNFRPYPRDVTVAELLKSAGYGTALIGKWGLGHEGSMGVPTKKGFDYFFGFLDQTHAHNSYPSFVLRNEQRVKLQNVVPNEGAAGQGVASEKRQFVGDLYIEEMLKFLDQNQANPFFLYAAFTFPHANNEGKTCEVPDLGIYKDKDWPEAQKKHAALITRLDTYVGQIMGKLKDLGIDDDTIVFFTSDNGAHKEGGNDPEWSHSSGPLRGIKRDLYDGGIRVPMICRWPGQVAAGTTSDQVWAFWDFLPTAAEIASVKAPNNLDGISMLPAILGKPQKNQHEFLYWEFHESGFKQAVRHGDWKAIRKGTKEPLELYNLKTDLAEAKNVAKDHPQVVKKIEAYLAAARTESKEFPIREVQRPRTQPRNTTQRAQP